MLHAGGDAAIDMVLAALEQSGGAAWQPLRPRIEHGDMLEPAQFERAKQLGVTIVQNPSHFMLPAVMAARLGARTARIDMMRGMIAEGVPVATRVRRPDESLPERDVRVDQREQSGAGDDAGAGDRRLHARLGAGGAARNQKGTLSPGMLADLAILSQDIFKVPADALPATVSVLTVVGGKVVHEQR